MTGRSKKRQPEGLRRRDFLTRSFLWASAGLLPAPFKGLGDPRTGGETSPDDPPAPAFEDRLTPHYRQPIPLDAALKKVEPGFDTFITEKYAKEIEALLSNWSAGLVQAPAEFGPVEACLSAGFMGSILQPLALEEKRAGQDLTVWRGRFTRGPKGGQAAVSSLDREAFRGQLKSLLDPPPGPDPGSRFLTAEFKLAALRALDSSGSRLRTHIRYDLVATGARFHRYERVGVWELEWAKGKGDTWQVEQWQAAEETSSIVFAPLFADVTERALGANASYREQILRGTDYWRTALDGASRIDVYGNNGIAVGDIDGDGFDDLYICQPSGLPNRLYRNRGDGTFEDVTVKAGVGVLDNTPCALLADLSNSGRQDLIVVTVDGPLLFLNDGGGQFRFKPEAFRFTQPPQGTFTGAALADYDGDGRLDVYFCLYSYYRGVNQYQVPVPYYDAKNGPPNFLMHNEGDGTFRDVTAASGMNVNNNRYSFACGWADFDGDGRPDLCVANDFGRKNLYHNNGDGTFTDIAREAGVEDVGAGMSVCWFDYDNDGRQDLYIANMWSSAGKRVTSQETFLKNAADEVRMLLRKHSAGNSLFHNEGNGRFTDQSEPAGVQMGRWSWSSDAWDFDHDSYPDIYIANGMVSGPDPRELSSFFWRQVVAETPFNAIPSVRYEQGWNAINELIRSDGTWAGYQRNNFFINNHDGTFSEVSGAVGLDFIDDSRAVALTDLDHDGRLEMLLKNRTGPQLRILHNEMRDLGASIAFRLRGHKSNRDAVGTVITVECGGTKQSRFIQAGSGFLSQHTKDLYFGLGKTLGQVRATVRWPSGLGQRFEDLPAGHLITIEEGAAQFQAEAFRFFSPSSPTSSPDARSASRLPVSAESWLLAPVAAPDFSLVDVTGRKRNLEDFRGRPLLLSFWKTPSATSERNLAFFEQRQARWASQGLQLVTLNLNIGDRTPSSENARNEAGPVRQMVQEKKYSFPVLFATEDIAAVYNILYRYLFDRRRDLLVPTSFLIDANGQIVKVYEGPLNATTVEDDFRRIRGTAAEPMNNGLPFPGRMYGGEFHRNQFTYALVFLERGYLDQALASCRLVLEREPENAEARYLVGMVYLKKRMHEEARENFEQVLHTPPSHPDTWPNAWNNLGMLAGEEGRQEEAISAFHEAIRLNPGHTVALENLGNVYRQQRRWREAQATLERALETDSDDAGVNYSLAMTFAQQDDTQRAERFFDAALKLRPDYPEALNNLGILYLRTERIERGVKAFETCIRVAPGFDQAYLNLAKVYTYEGRADQAAVTLRLLLRQQPDHPLAKKMLAELTH